MKSQQNRIELVTRPGGVQAPGNGCKYACTHPDCSDSPKTWASKTSVQMHYNDVHQSSFEGKIWKCDKCPKTFIAEKLLKIHMTAKHSEGVFPCSLCGAVLKDKHRSESDQYCFFCTFFH